MKDNSGGFIQRQGQENGVPGLWQDDGEKRQMSGFIGSGGWMAAPDGMLTAGNINLHNRPRVKNPDGTISTVRSITMDMADGGAILLPTVSNEGTIMEPREAAEYWRKKGQNLGTFSSVEAANRYAQQLHQAQAGEYVY